MPFATINIEETGPHKWRAEVEVGFPVCRRVMVLQPTFDDLIRGVVEAYRGMLPVNPTRPVEGPSPPIDESALPEMPPAPLGKGQAQDMRDQADGIDLHDRTHCVHGVALGDHCPEHGAAIRPFSVAAPQRRGRPPRAA